jgi:hypothetical protein
MFRSFVEHFGNTEDNDPEIEEYKKICSELGLEKLKLNKLSKEEQHWVEGGLGAARDYFNKTNLGYTTEIKNVFRSKRTAILTFSATVPYTGKVQFYMLDLFAQSCIFFTPKVRKKVLDNDEPVCVGNLVLLPWQSPAGTKRAALMKKINIDNKSLPSGIEL